MCAEGFLFHPPLAALGNPVILPSPLPSPSARVPHDAFTRPHRRAKPPGVDFNGRCKIRSGGTPEGFIVELGDKR